MKAQKREWTFKKKHTQKRANDTRVALKVKHLRKKKKAEVG